MTSGATNVAAVAAAIKDNGDSSSALPIAGGSRRHTLSKHALGRSALPDGLPSPPASLPTSKFLSDGKREIPENAIDDDPIDMSQDEGDGSAQKSRVRRASDGQPLLKEGKKSNRVELRCDKCGKGYKHSSCLSKHLLVHPSLRIAEARKPLVRV
jgi:hypothetical protein